MKIQLESTSMVVPVPNGCGGFTSGRLWKGFTEGGIAFDVIITAVTSDSESALAEFEAELQR